MAEQEQGRDRSGSGTMRSSPYVGYGAVLGCWATWLFWTGIIKSLAVLLPTFREQFQADTWLIGWMIAIVDSTVDFPGPIAAPIGKLFGVRAVVMISGVMVCAAFIIVSRVSSVVAMTVVLGLLVGPFVGFSNILCRDMIGNYYKERCFTPYLITQTGPSVAFMVFAPLTQFLLDTYGWRGALLLLGSIFLHLTVCGALLRYNTAHMTENIEFTTSYSHLESDPTTEQIAKSDPAAEERNFKSILKSVFKTLNTDLLLNIKFWLSASVHVFMLLAQYAWLIYFIPHVQSKGFSAVVSVEFTVVFGVSRLLSGIISGPLLNRYNVYGPIPCLGISILMMSLYYFLDPFLFSYWLNVVNIAMYGFVYTILVSLNDALLIDVIGTEQLASAIGWIATAGAVVRASLLFIPGLIYDLRGSYTLAFILMGFVNLIPAVSLLCLWCLQRNQK